MTKVIEARSRATPRSGDSVRLKEAVTVKLTQSEDQVHGTLAGRNSRPFTGRATMSADTACMRITEIYQSVQGESTYAGLPCVFVRTTGCDLRCSWCDSEFTFSGGTQMTLDQILAEVLKHDCKLVELTGGEPLLQPEIYELAARLADSGHTVLIETGGHRDISGLDPRVIRIMDLKCPASGECERNLWSNLKHLRSDDEVKFVIADRTDYEWTLKTIREHELEDRVKLLISTAFGMIEPEQVVGWMLEDKLRARFQLQLHKYIWPPDERGR